MEGDRVMCVCVCERERERGGERERHIFGALFFFFFGEGGNLHTSFRDGMFGASALLVPVRSSAFLHVTPTAGAPRTQKSRSPLAKNPPLPVVVSSREVGGREGVVWGGGGGGGGLECLLACRDIILPHLNLCDASTIKYLIVLFLSFFLLLLVLVCYNVRG